MKKKTRKKTGKKPKKNIKKRIKKNYSKKNGHAAFVDFKFQTLGKIYKNFTENVRKIKLN